MSDENFIFFFAFFSVDRLKSFKGTAADESSVLFVSFKCLLISSWSWICT